MVCKRYEYSIDGAVFVVTGGAGCAGCVRHTVHPAAGTVVPVRADGVVHCRRPHSGVGISNDERHGGLNTVWRWHDSIAIASGNGGRDEV